MRMWATVPDATTDGEFGRSVKADAVACGGGAEWSFGRASEKKTKKCYVLLNGCCNPFLMRLGTFATAQSS